MNKMQSYKFNHVQTHETKYSHRVKYDKMWSYDISQNVANDYWQNKSLTKTYVILTSKL
jgi:hypothetical protein